MKIISLILLSTFLFSNAHAELSPWQKINMQDAYDYLLVSGNEEIVTTSYGMSLLASSQIKRVLRIEFVLDNKALMYNCIFNPAKQTSSWESEAVIDCDSISSDETLQIIQKHYDDPHRTESSLLINHKTYQVESLSGERDSWEAPAMDGCHRDEAYGMIGC